MQETIPNTHAIFQSGISCNMKDNVNVTKHKCLIYEIVYIFLITQSRRMINLSQWPTTAKITEFHMQLQIWTYCWNFFDLHVVWKYFVTDMEGQFSPISYSWNSSKKKLFNKCSYASNKSIDICLFFWTHIIIWKITSLSRIIRFILFDSIYSNYFRLLHYPKKRMI